MILVVGATGILGGEICARLRAAGRPVRAMVRPTSAPARVQRLRDLGAETVTGDLRDRASLDRACRGVEAVITTVSTTLSRQPDDSIDRTDRDGQLQLVDAARDAGVSHFVYTSFSGQLDRESPLRDAKRSVESHLRESGLRYTILRPSLFMEIWLSPALGFDYPGRRARILGSGENPISYVSVADVARFAVAALDNPAARDAVLELGGPEALSPLEVVRIFEEVGGQPIEREHVPEAALRAQAEAARDPMEKTFAVMMLGIAGGDPIDMDATLRRFPLRLDTVRSYAERVLAPRGEARAPEPPAR